MHRVVNLSLYMASPIILWTALALWSQGLKCSMWSVTCLMALWHICSVPGVGRASSKLSTGGSCSWGSTVSLSSPPSPSSTSSQLSRQCGNKGLGSSFGTEASMDSVPKSVVIENTRKSTRASCLQFAVSTRHPHTTLAHVAPRPLWPTPVAVGIIM